MFNEVVSLLKCLVQPFHERVYCGETSYGQVEWQGIPRTGAQSVSSGVGVPGDWRNFCSGWDITWTTTEQESGISASIESEMRCDLQDS